MQIKANLSHFSNTTSFCQMPFRHCQQQTVAAAEVLAWIEHSEGRIWGYLSEAKTGVAELSPFENEARRFGEIDQARNAVGLAFGENERNLRVEVGPPVGNAGLEKNTSALHRCVEIEESVGRGQRYLVRADIELGPPFRVFPFRIVKIVQIGDRRSFGWRAPRGGWIIGKTKSISDIEMARLVLREWACRTIP